MPPKPLSQEEVQSRVDASYAATVPKIRREELETVRVPGYIEGEIEPGKIYVCLGTPVAAENGPSVTYRCPCGCNQMVYLPCRPEGTERTRTPQWGLSVSENGRATITPSVLETGGCRSHYFIREGRVQWC